MLPNQLANSLQPLCYEHHTAMSVVQILSGSGSPAQEFEYACQGSDCSARYTVNTDTSSPLATGLAPRKRCSRTSAARTMRH